MPQYEVRHYFTYVDAYSVDAESPQHADALATAYARRAPNGIPPYVRATVQRLHHNTYVDYDGGTVTEVTTGAVSDIDWPDADHLGRPCPGCGRVEIVATTEGVARCLACGATVLIGRDERGQVTTLHVWRAPAS